jgi:predicted ester cyclase
VPCGIPATGKRITVSGIAIYRLVGAKIAEFSLQNDDIGMMLQLGLVSPLGWQ